jgi:hypothetical protein
MNQPKASAHHSPTRRDFLKQSGVTLTTAALASSVAARSYAAEDNTINVALIGCGGRGTGAAQNALSTSGPTKLVAMADVFDSRLQSSYKNLAGRFADQVDVPPDRQFVGLDGFRKAIDCLGRRRCDPGHAACFSSAAPGIRGGTRPERVHGEIVRRRCARNPPRDGKAGDEATKKNLKIAGG